MNVHGVQFECELSGDGKHQHDAQDGRSDRIFVRTGVAGANHSSTSVVLVHAVDNKANGGGNLATVKSRLTDINGRPIGTTNNNPMLDDREYKIELEDGTTDRIFAKKVAENIYLQLDDIEREILKFRDIVDHRKDGTALAKENGFTP